ncbi:hypothetical protein GGP41_009092 [Bipolaris sorokiniana]|uniref:Hydrophobin n=1 Tax=Cochliobolus sativus TaxID=45130 RepID=A0A8H5ZGX5_COCSA|nr:hypothetical protein GGP41_009092 [Bipolaris sorokiniana]
MPSINTLLLAALATVQAVQGATYPASGSSTYPKISEDGRCATNGATCLGSKFGDCCEANMKLANVVTAVAIATTVAEDATQCMENAPVQSRLALLRHLL